MVGRFKIMQFWPLARGGQIMSFRSMESGGQTAHFQAMVSGGHVTIMHIWSMVSYGYIIQISLR